MFLERPTKCSMTSKRFPFLFSKHSDDVQCKFFMTPKMFCNFCSKTNPMTSLFSIFVLKHFLNFAIVFQFFSFVFFKLFFPLQRFSPNFSSFFFKFFWEPYMLSG